MEERFFAAAQEGRAGAAGFADDLPGADLWLRADRAARQPLRRAVYAQGGNALPDFIPAGGRRADRSGLAAGDRACSSAEDLFRDGKGQRRK